MRKESFAVILIKWICWSFVAGVGIANIIGPQERDFMLKMWALCGAFFVLSVYLFFAAKNLSKFTLIPAFLVLGLASYQWRFDTSNPYHIKNFIDSDRWTKTCVTGVVVEDPDVRDWITHVTIQPETIVKGPDSPLPEETELSGRTGKVVLFVSRNIRTENNYYDNIEYGDRIEVKGALTEPMKLSNPYGFDYAKYLRNKNVYASMYVGEPGNIKFIEKSALGYFGRIKRFAYSIKDKMILGIKKTLPPPASAFVGGVTIGARGGVPEVIKYDFQATGVAHVLALSGLHVGFLAFMLVMFFNNFFKSPFLFYRLPSKIFRREIDLTPYSQKLIPLFIIMVLAVFVIITGARPATIRASMMYSIGIVFLMWFGMNIKRTGGLTIPMSAAIMLAFNSFLIYDASFALSFTAVWSIIYLSGPLRQIFSRIIVGWGQAVFLFYLVSSIVILVVSPWLFSSGSFITLYLGLLGILSALAYFLEKKRPLRGFEYEGWWPYIAGFFCVQLSIQLGMMWPLSGVYFNRFPIAGILANFIAIPLIGIIVPLGIIGELFTFIPGIGEHLGLAIGGANTLFSDFFLVMAKFFRSYFPYPVQSAPPSGRLAVYYGIILIFAFNRGIRKFLTKKVKVSSAASKWAVSGLIIFIFSSGYWGKNIVKGAPREKDELLVTFFDVEFGNSVLIQTPKGKAILVDGGARGDKRYWTMGKFGKGQSVIVPNLSGYNIPALDIMVITNPLPENTGGLVYLLKHFRVKEVADSLDPEKFPSDITYFEFLRRINDIRLEVQRDDPLPIGCFLNYYDILNTPIAPESAVSGRSFKEKVFNGKLIPHYQITQGEVLCSEEVEGKKFEIKALNPPKDRISGTESDLMNNSLVLKITYGERTILLPSNIQAEGEEVLVNSYNTGLKSDILLVPDHGSGMASSYRFLDRVSPSIAVIQYGYLKDRSFYDTELKRTIGKYERRKIKIYRTDEVGAVEIRTDGKELKVKTVLGEKS